MESLDGTLHGVIRIGQRLNIKIHSLYGRLAGCAAIYVLDFISIPYR